MCSIYPSLNDQRRFIARNTQATLILYIIYYSNRNCKFLLLLLLLKVIEDSTQCVIQKLVALVGSAARSCRHIIEGDYDQSLPRARKSTL